MNQKKKKVTVIMLAAAILMMVAGSFFAGMFNTSFFTVDVEEIEFETERGTLNGLLYMPKGAR